MLTGDAPFPQGTIAQRVLQHQSAEPADIRDVRPDAPSSLLAICRKMMAKAPADRYQSGDEVSLALSDWLGIAPSASATNSFDAAPAGPSLNENLTLAPLNDEPGKRSKAATGDSKSGGTGAKSGVSTGTGSGINKGQSSSIHKGPSSAIKNGESSATRKADGAAAKKPDSSAGKPKSESSRPRRSFQIDTRERPNGPVALGTCSAAGSSSQVGGASGPHRHEDDRMKSFLKVVGIGLAAAACVLGAVSFWLIWYTGGHL